VSTSAGTPPEPSDGRPPGPRPAGRDLRDSLWGKALILGVLLLFTLLVSRTCVAGRDEVTQQEALEIAIASASFTPCAEDICRQVRFVQRGVPPIGYWAVVLSEEVDAQGRPNRIESFLVNASTGDLSTP
jgi:hypothetical protein